MSNQLRETYDTYVSEIQKVQQTPEKWKEFLDFAANVNITDIQRNTEFSTKLLIHAVNPSAKDCRIGEEWDDIGRPVNLHEKGIPVLTYLSNGSKSVEYLFDTGQTEHPETPQHSVFAKDSQQTAKSELNKTVNEIAANTVLSDKSKKILCETAEYKLSKQYGLETNENPDRFAGIESLSVSDIALMGIELNKCGLFFEEKTKQLSMETTEQSIAEETPKINTDNKIHEAMEGIWLHTWANSDDVEYNEIEVDIESVDELLELPHDVQENLAKKYNSFMDELYAKGYTEPEVNSEKFYEDGVVKLPRELIKEINKELSINDFKKIIHADELSEKGIDISFDCNYRLGSGGKYEAREFSDPCFVNTDEYLESISAAFDRAFDKITFTNSDNEQVSFESFSSLKNAIDNPDNNFFHAKELSKKQSHEEYVKDTPLFSRSKIMSDDFKPTSDKSRDDMHKTQVKNHGIEI